jgi:hypothetical protein
VRPRKVEAKMSRSLTRARSMRPSVWPNLSLLPYLVFNVNATSCVLTICPCVVSKRATMSRLNSESSPYSCFSPFVDFSRGAMMSRPLTSLLSRSHHVALIASLSVLLNCAIWVSRMELICSSVDVPTENLDVSHAPVMDRVQTMY